MSKICGYSCPHNKGGVCQITGCIYKISITTTTKGNDKRMNKIYGYDKNIYETNISGNSNLKENEKGIFIELPKDKIEFYGNTEEEKKLNETVFDLSLEISGLHDEIKELKKIIDTLEKDIEDKIYTIEPKGTCINYNCEYDSEEDYIRAMKEQSRLNTLKETLSKLKEMKEGK